MIPILTLVIGSMLFGATFFTTGLLIGYKIRGYTTYPITNVLLKEIKNEETLQIH